MTVSPAFNPRKLPQSVRGHLAALRDDAAAIVQVAGEAEYALGVARGINEQRDVPLRTQALSRLNTAMAVDSLTDCKELVACASESLRRACEEDRTEAERSYDESPAYLTEIRQGAQALVEVTRFLLSGEEPGPEAA